MTQIPVVQVPMRLLDTPPMLAVDEPVAPALFQQTWQSLSETDVITPEIPGEVPEPQPVEDNQDESEAPISVTLPVIENQQKQSLIKPNIKILTSAQKPETQEHPGQFEQPVVVMQLAVPVEAVRAPQEVPPALPIPVLARVLPEKSLQTAATSASMAPQQVVTAQPSAPSAPAVFPAPPTDVVQDISPPPPPPPPSPIATSPAISSMPASFLPALAVAAPVAFRLMPSDDGRDTLLAVPPAASELTPGPHIAPGQPQAAHRAPPVHVAQQLAVALTASDTGTTEVTLNPEELGRVRLSLTPSDTGITVSIMAERPDTADLMRRHLGTLTREFQAIGYDNVNFDFTGDGGADSDQKPQEGAVTAQPADIAPPPPVPAGIAMLSLAGLDLKF